MTPATAALQPKGQRPAAASCKQHGNNAEHTKATRDGTVSPPAVGKVYVNMKTTWLLQLSNCDNTCTALHLHCTVKQKEVAKATIQQIQTKRKLAERIEGKPYPCRHI